MDTGSTEHQKKAENTEEVHIVDQANAILNLHVLDEIDGCNGSIENLAQVNVTAKTKNKKKKKKTKKKVDNKDDVHIVDQVDAMVHLHSLDEKHGCNGSTEIFAEGNLLQTNLNVQPLAKHSGMDSGSMENLSDRNKVSKEKKKKKKAEVKEENQSMDRAKIDTGSTECHNKAENKDEVHIVDQVDAMLNLHSLDENHGCNGSTETLAEGNVNNKSKKRKKKPKVEDEVQSMVQPNFKLNSDLSNENHKQGNDDKLTENQCTAQFPRIAVMAPIRRKLLVLDINGLLADIVMPAPKNCRGDIHMLGRAIFRRPFYDDFLKFCFHNFDVGIWSSRSRRVIDKVVDYLLGDQKYKLLFCWDMSYCTQTGFKTLDQRHKPLVCKVLQKIWDADFPNLPWKKGDYNETNTLLLDDSPYKALLNPLHTAVFPCSYDYRNRNDKSLGPGGDLRVYLEGLLTSENVQKYVEQHPFGQSAIGQTHSSWGFYSNVLQAMSTDLKVPHSLPTLS
ncbi:hypothetical protein ACJIZ3_022803 [Penstemon smallii]|uniref:Mitochondrial import inner membrane translocase subunit TIM50 n=1 Tax=Penstemon smallii TaxID=265156 RepID=A0ABD3TN69_9LAMI